MDSDTKRHIDAARQVLVGVVPNPASQIDQITNALIYKFMDDMDRASINAEGEATFFTGDLKPYAWKTCLMDSRVGNRKRMKLYSDALDKFSEAEQLPELFREIFTDAFLPYRSPETLGLFLKEINYFDYSHPEELGNAYEYLLSIMSSQGDAGQFRTPRHIIDFIVDVVNPTKDDKILDPACGTGGFLVSSYRRILEQHDGKDDPEKKEKPLTYSDREKLKTNFEGYEIDPGMARIARVNMYLHQFKTPQIHQYDTLSDDLNWEDKFDVILANPPFMSPKGGIRPHNKFSIGSSRSEVLFVDYIMSHLRPKGRAGIIVPEGIIFQTGTAYKELRKNLVEDGLYAVVSLPSGVFQPYSGVKTSILLFNKEVAKQHDEILFMKVKNDGFALGATRRPIDKNDLPVALDILNKWLTGEKSDNKLVVYVKKTKIAEDGEYNLTGDHYRETVDYSNVKWPLVELGEVCVVSSGNTAPQDEKLFIGGKHPFYRTSDVGAVHLSDNLKDVRDWLNDEGIKGLKLFKKGTILFPKSGASTFLNHRVIMGLDGYVSSHLATIAVKDGLGNEKYIYYILSQIDAKDITPDQAYPSLKISDIAKIKVPLPPLEVQEQIVSEIGQYQKIINGATQVVHNWKPYFRVEPEWPTVKLGEVAEVVAGQSPRGKYYNEVGEGIPFYQGKTEFSEVSIRTPRVWTTETTKIAEQGDILMSVRAPVGPVNISTEQVCIGRGLASIRAKRINRMFLFYYLKSIEDDIRGNGGAVFDSISKTKIMRLSVPLPSPEIQEQVVAEIEAEQKAIEECKTLIETTEKKIKAKVSEIWGE